MKSYMRNNNKKILIIILIFICVIIALGVSVLAMTVTGNLALNDKQKLAKGLKDTIEKVNEMYPEAENNFIQDYNKMYTTPFEQTTAITGSINQLKASDIDEYEQILTELKKLVTEIKITNTVQADLSNNVIKENLKFGVGDAIEEISVDLEYNKDTIGFRSKELNEEYLFVSKNDIQENMQYEEYTEIFEMLENIGNKPNLEALSFTEEEKQHFQENYSGIFSKYLTEEMITSTAANITIDGEVKECSAVTLTFDKEKIQAIMGEYLQKFENDSTGKAIIVNKLKLVEDFTEEELIDFVNEFRDSLVNLGDDAKISFTVYCTNFKTYAIEVELYSNKVNLILGKDVINLEVSSDDIKVVTGTIVSNQMNIIVNKRDGTQTINLKKQGNIIEVAVNNTTEEYDNTFIFAYEEITKTDIESKQRYSMRYAINTEYGGGDFTINADTSFKYVDSISTTSFTDENSLSLITGNTTDLQNYINTVKTKGMAILQKAQENSAFIKQMLTIMELNQNIGDDVQDTNNEYAVMSFNALFEKYKGVQRGVGIKSLLENVGTNNQNSTHIVTVVIVGQDNSVILNTNNSVEMVIAMNDIVHSGEYIVAMAQYDEEGYIKTIAIKKNFE